MWKFFKKIIKPQEPKRSVYWGGIAFPEDISTQHFLIAGGTGSGKTHCLRLLMKSVLPYVGKGIGRRAVIYDSKRDTHRLLKVLFKDSPPPIIHLNPFVTAGAPWWISKDVNSPARALHVAELLISDSNNANANGDGTFFVRSARNLLGGLIQAFQYLAPERWTLRDVVWAFSSMSSLKRVLSKAPEGRGGEFVKKIEEWNERTMMDILSTVSSDMEKLKLIAAAWHNSGKPAFSIEEFLQTEAVLVLGNDPQCEAVVRDMNRLVFKLLVETVRSKPDVEAPLGELQTWFIIDEFRNAGKLPDIEKLLTEGRSKGACVVLGFQTLPGLTTVYGKEFAQEIIGICENKAFLWNAEPETVAYASLHFNDHEMLRRTMSDSNNGRSYNFQVHRQRLITEDQIKGIPLPIKGVQGVAGFADVPRLTEPFRFEISTGELDEQLPILEPDELKTIDASYQILKPWTFHDFERLKIGDEPEDPSSPASLLPKRPSPKVSC